MAFNSSEWTIDYTAKTVTNNDSGTGNNLASATEDDSHVGEILDFFKWLAQTFASSAQMDDEYPIQSDTPTVYKWLNGWGFGHVDDTKYLRGGAIVSSDGKDLWSNIYSIGSQVVGTQLYIIQNDTEVTPWWHKDNIDILIKVKSGGTFIQSVNTAGVLTDGGVWVYAREYGDEYDHGFADLSAGGRNPIGINTAGDGSNNTAAGTVSGYNDITITFGSISRDLNNGNGAQNYDVEIDCATRPMTEVYEYLKYVTRYGSTVQLNGDDGQEYRSANEGIYLEVKKAPFGSIAGSTLYGARGVWFKNYASADFVLIDSNATAQTPPNYRKVLASHASLNGTNILVAEESGGSVVKNQYTIDSVTSNTIVATTNIDIHKTPQSGTAKLGDTKYAYTGFSAKTLTGVTPDPTGKTGDFYIPLLDVTADAITEASDDIIYGSDISVITSVRKYGYKPYDVTTTFSSTGLSFSPILSVDPQAT